MYHSVQIPYFGQPNQSAQAQSAQAQSAQAQSDEAQSAQAQSTMPNPGFRSSQDEEETRKVNQPGGDI